MPNNSASALPDVGLSNFLLGEYGRISTLLSEEFDSRQEPLTTEILQSIATDQSVRLGDLLETLFVMGMFNEWIYLDSEGERIVVDDPMLDDLLSKGRLSKDDLANYTGVWIPY